MSRNIARAVATVVLGVASTVQAGELEPAEPPAPTMVTLQQIYDKIGECTGEGICGIPKTGQVSCSDGSGAVIPCAGTGQDGEYQAGVSVAPRFTDNLDGTITDNLTGLTWLKNANCFGAKLWPAAVSDANGLADGACGLTDGSTGGDWRLPNVRELQTLVHYGATEPTLPPSHPFSQVQHSFYWTSTSQVSSNNAYHVRFDWGFTGTNTKTSLQAFVWPVRGGL